MLDILSTKYLEKQPRPAEGGDLFPILNIIKKYKYNEKELYLNYFPSQNNIIENFIQFIQQNPNCFFRENIEGHITGSAFVLNQSRTKVLLTYHAKLKKWLQLGGHADGEFIIQNVALKEAQEESGIVNFNFIDILKDMSSCSQSNIQEIIPFDLDIHLIPVRNTEPAHYHYDVRFILIANNEDYKISPESLDLKWINLEDVSHYTRDKSTLRQVKKVQYLLNNFNL